MSESNDRDRWIPRTPLEKLIQIDTLLAEIIPSFTDARERIADTLPGHSGRPAGTGEPGGGRGASTTSVVERLTATDGERSTWERSVTILDELDRLAVKIVDRLVALFPSVTGPFDNGAVRRLVWARWLVRQVVAFGESRVRRIPARQLVRLHDDVARLHKIVTLWCEPREGGTRSPLLAVDTTDQLCRSCLRIGARNDRDPRYPQRSDGEGGLCRWCGDFHAEQGFLPTLMILDAHESGAHGSTIAKLIRDEHKAREPSSNRKKHRRRKARR